MYSPAHNQDRLRLVGNSIRLLCGVTVVITLTACVSTSVKQTEKPLKPVVISCPPYTIPRPVDASTVTKVEVNQQVTAISEKDKNNQTVKPKKPDCIPKGSIEIAEKYNIAPETKLKFEQAVKLLGEEKYAEAIELLQQVTDKADKYTGPYINLGIAYIRINELGKAEENLNKALALKKEHPVASNELGIVYRKSGRYKEARELYEVLLKLYPDFLPAHKNLGVLCDIYIQDLACAVEQYSIYLKALPDDEKVKIWLADVKNRL